MEYAACLYASKPCANPRSLKDNGELHRLCTLHRTKANDAQRRWHSRKRTQPTADKESAEAPREKKRRTSNPYRRPSVVHAPPRGLPSTHQSIASWEQTAAVAVSLPAFRFHELASCSSLGDEDFAILSDMLGGGDDCRLSIGVTAISDPHATTDKAWWGHQAPETIAYSF